MTDNLWATAATAIESCLGAIHQRNERFLLRAVVDLFNVAKKLNNICENPRRDRKGGQVRVRGRYMGHPIDVVVDKDRIVQEE